MRIFVFILGLLIATSAFAQDAVVTADAPIYVRPDAAKPIRTAAVGTVLRVVAEEGEWVQVQFHDPQWGPRTGWVRAGLLDVPRPETTPMDLSIRSRGTTPSPQALPAPEPVFTPRTRPLERPPFRVHTVGRAGATFGTATAALAGVEVSGDVLPALQVYGSFDWHQDVLPKDIANLVKLQSDLSGVPIEIKFPTYAVIGGVKAIAPTRSVRPYGLGGFGIAHARGKVLIFEEDQTALALDLLGLEKSDISFTKAIAEGGGGIVIPAGRAYFDVGYRFRKVLDAEGINVSGVYFGAGFSY